jgi:hypothetical protein
MERKEQENFLEQVILCYPIIQVDSGYHFFDEDYGCDLLLELLLYSALVVFASFCLVFWRESVSWFNEGIAWYFFSDECDVGVVYEVAVVLVGDYSEGSMLLSCQVLGFIWSGC